MALIRGSGGRGRKPAARPRAPKHPTHLSRKQLQAGNSPLYSKDLLWGPHGGKTWPGHSSVTAIVPWPCPVGGKTWPGQPSVTAMLVLAWLADGRCSLRLPGLNGPGTCPSQTPPPTSVEANNRPSRENESPHTASLCRSVPFGAGHLATTANASTSTRAISLYNAMATSVSSLQQASPKAGSSRSMHRGPGRTPSD